MGHLSTLLSYDEWVNRVFDVITYPLSHINHVMGVSAGSTDVSTCPCSVWLAAYMMRVHHCSGHKVDSYTTTVHLWWRHQMETFSALLAICAGNSPVHGEFPAQRPVTRSFDVFFDLHLNKRLSKQSWGWWFETPSHPLWRRCNEWR